MKRHVLVVSCDFLDSLRVGEALSSGSGDAFEVEYVSKLSAALERIDKGLVSIILLDLERPDGQALAIFEKLRSTSPDIPILILSVPDAESIARQTLEHGAQDYLLKSHLDGFRLSRMVRTMIERNAA